MLTIFKTRDGTLADALREAKVPRNTLRDFLGMCELRILDERKYEATIGAIKRENEKPSVKDFERACRKELLRYYDEINEKKNLKVLLPIMTQKSFYENQ